MIDDSLIPLPAGAEQAILGAVDDLFEQQLEFLEQLVRFPSLRGREGDIQRYVSDRLTNRGYQVEVVPFDSDALASHPGAGAVTDQHSRVGNVVGHLDCSRAGVGRSLILNAHVDVVPTGPSQRWTHPPFEPVRHDGWLYGRGSGDMKAGLAVNIFAVDALRTAGFAPAAPVCQQSVVEEESSGNGTLLCLGHPAYADAALISEPEDEMLVRANVGVIWFRVAITGLPAHVRSANAGQSAIDSAASVIDRLRRLERRWNDERDSYHHFAGVERPIVFNPGVIRGGDWPSSVPSWCTVDARIATYPGMDIARARAEIEQAIASAGDTDALLARSPAAVTYTGFMAGGYTLEEGSDAECTLARSHRAVTGSDLRAFVTPGYLDARVFAHYTDTPCLVYGPIAENIHAYDERVLIESIRRTTKTVALFVATWCGVDGR